MRYFIHLAYNGTKFHGWQIQPNASSVQETLENALSLLLKSPIHLIGCGRTDTGVHASDFYAHFDSENILDEKECLQLANRLNAFLCDDIAIYKIFRVAETAHTRFDALSRTYQYHITTNKQPFKQEFAHRIYYKPDIELMNKACEILFEYEDFTSFSKVHTQTKTNLCKIFYAHWKEIDDELIFTIKANRFLRNMVRAVTGTLLDIGREKIQYQDMHTIIQAKNRSDAGTSLPAKALFLTKVEYPDNIFKNEDTDR